MENNRIKIRVIAFVLAAALLISGVGIGLYIHFSDKPDDSTENVNSSFNTIVGKFTDRKIEDEDSAILAVQDVAEELGLENATEELTLKSANTVDNLTYHRLQQNYQGIPVYGSTFVVISDENGEAQGLTGNVADVNTDISLTPTVTQEQIEASIRAYVGEDVEISVPELSDDMLVIYNYDDVEKATLAYEIYIYTEKYVIDAHSARILCVNSSLNALIATGTDEKTKTQKFDVFYDEKTKQYQLFDETRSIIVASLDGKDHKIEETFVISLINGGVKSAVSTLKPEYTDIEVFAYTNTIKLFEFYKAYGVENMFDSIFVFYNDGAGEGNNAYGGCAPNNDNIGCIYLGTNYDITAIDVMGHEFSHVISRKIVDWNDNFADPQNIGQVAPGAINEGIADLFGVLAEAHIKNADPDWNLYLGTVGRELTNPDFKVLPENISGIGVRQLQTVVSYAAYLMTQDNIKGGKLSISELTDLWYHTLYTLPSNCTFSALRSNMEMVAKSLGFSWEKQLQISASFEQVGIKSMETVEIYGVGATLQVYGAGFDLYDDYTVEIEGTEISLLPDRQEKYHDTIVVTNANPVDLNLKKGTYTITVTDNLNPSNSYSKKIKIAIGNYTNDIVIATDFGINHSHTYIFSHQAATCTTGGWSKDVCACGDEKLIQAVPALGHIFIDWTITKQPTETAKGEKVRTCSVCGEKETEEIPMLNHTHVYTETSQAATCTAPGWEKQVCSCGDVKDEKVLPIINHNYVGGKCSMCGSTNIVVESQGLEFSLNSDGTYTVTGIGTCTDTDVVIPAMYNGEKVTAIGKSAFQGCDNLTSVEIPNSVMSIGDYAFHCSNLTSIEIPNSVTSIGDFAFWVCDDLTSVEIPNSVMSIGDYAFQFCTGLTRIEIPASVMSMGDYVFGDCNSLIDISVDEHNQYFCSLDGILFNKTKTKLICYPSGKSEKMYHIPSTVTSIGNGAFGYCRQLTNVEIPDSVTDIGKSAFEGCFNLENIKIPSSVTSVLEHAFHYCNSLIEILYGGTTTQWKAIRFGLHWNTDTDNYTVTCTDGTVSKGGIVTPFQPEANGSQGLEFTSNGDGTYTVTGIGTCTDTDVVIPSMYNGESVTRIGNQAFYGCSNLISVVIPESVTNIEEAAFYNCRNLESIVIPDNITFVGNSAFYDCPLNGTVYENAIYLGNESNPYVVLLKAENNSMTSYNIHENTRWIYDKAFYQNSNLESIVIFGNVLGIGNGAFAGCRNLSSVIMGNSVEHIGAFAFAGCKSLIGIEFPDSVTAIGEQAFAGCGFITIKIPNTVINIGVYAFASCDNLTTVVISDGLKSLGESMFEDCVNLTAVEIPDSVSEIGDCAFARCINLVGIKIPSGVTVIGDGVFAYCESMTSIEIPNEVTIIGNSAFSSCKGLTNIKLPNGVMIIDDYAFSNCENLISIEIPDSVTVIGDYAFEACVSLISIEIPAGVTNIGENVFFECIALTEIAVDKDNRYYCSIEGVLFNADVTELLCYPSAKSWTVYTIPSTVTSLAKNSFANSDNLESVILPMGLQSIGDSAFYRCMGLESIEIPDSVTNIGGAAFRVCGRLKSIKIGNGLINIGSSAFYQCFDFVIYYNGTVKQWLDRSSEFANNWNAGTRDYTIFCTDGTVSKDGVVTPK